MSSKKKIAEALEALIDGIAGLDARVGSVSKRVEAVAAEQASARVLALNLAEGQARIERATYELAREVRRIEERLVEEAEIRAGVGLSVLDHDVQLSLIRGGRASGGGDGE